MRERGRLPGPWVAAAIALGALVLAHLGSPGQALLVLAWVAPALALFVALATGRFPGERLLLSVRRRPSPRASAAPIAPARWVRVTRGGALLAAALAGRAPPAAAVPTL